MGAASQYVGGDAKLGDNLVASYYFAKLKDYYKQHYLGAVHTLRLGRQAMLVSATCAYLEQRLHMAHEQTVPAVAPMAMFAPSACTAMALLAVKSTTVQ